VNEADSMLYAEAASTWRTFAAWREKTLAGYLTILAGLGFAFHHNVSAPVRAVLLLGGAVVSLIFWILDVRNNQLLNACQKVAAELEGPKGCFGALVSIHDTRHTRRERLLTYSAATDLLAGTVGAGCAVAAVLYLTKVARDRWELLPFGAVAVVLAGVSTYVLHCIRPADSRCSGARMLSPNKETQLTGGEGGAHAGKSDVRGSSSGAARS